MTATMTCHGIFMRIMNKKRSMFCCYDCKHINVNMYRMRRHYRGVHLRNNTPMVKKRKYMDADEGKEDKS